MSAFKPILLLTVLLISLNGCAGDSGEDTFSGCEAVAAETDYSILFIGNSLTFTNNLPELVTSKASEMEITLATKMIAYPNYALEDHWNDGDIQQLIACGIYDFVIIQQGPSSQAEGRASLLEYGGKIAELCNANGAELAFFMVWPALANYNTFPGVIANYTDAAEATSAILCPVGRVWKEYFDKTSDYSYYGPDNFHPSREGSLVAAEVILASLLN